MNMKAFLGAQSVQAMIDRACKVRMFVPSGHMHLLRREKERTNGNNSPTMFGRLPLELMTVTQGLVTASRPKQLNFHHTAASLPQE